MSLSNAWHEARALDQMDRERDAYEAMLRRALSQAEARQLDVLSHRARSLDEARAFAAACAEDDLAENQTP